MSQSKSAVSRSADDTRDLGRALGLVLQAGDVIALSGELGAGKTCFVQGVALGLGVDPSIPVTSPTFVLAGEYPGKLPLRHADFYRVEGPQRLYDAGFDDYLDGRAVLVVEWPELVPGMLPEERLEIRIELVEHAAASATGASAQACEPPRCLTLSGQGARASTIKDMLSDSWV